MMLVGICPNRKFWKKRLKLTNRSMPMRELIRCFRGYAVRAGYSVGRMLGSEQRSETRPGQIPGRIPRMATQCSRFSQGWGILVALAMLVLCSCFPIGLMIFNPTLMFQRGWEQYVGTAIYLWAVVTLGRELRGLWRNEKAFDEAPRLLQYIGGCSNAAVQPQEQGEGRVKFRRLPPVSPATERILHVRVRQLVGQYSQELAPPPRLPQLMEVNREASGLDQEHMAGRFTLTRYILYLLPVIGFIGTVEGISEGLDEHQ